MEIPVNGPFLSDSHTLQNQIQTHTHCRELRFHYGALRAFQSVTVLGDRYEMLLKVIDLNLSFCEAHFTDMKLTTQPLEGLNVERFLEIKSEQGILFQKLRINHGDGVFTDEWFAVQSDQIPIKDKNEEFWKSLDWDKTSRELATENPEWNYATICKKRATYGHKKLGTAKTRHIDWKNIDWANKSNQELSGELGVEANTVVGFRARVKGEPCAIKYKKHKRLVTDEMLIGVDWEHTRDIELARKWNVSRERVRQIRQKEQKPRFIEPAWHYSESKQFKQWLLDNRPEIEGKPARAVAEMWDGNLNNQDRYRHMKASGIKFSYQKTSRYGRWIDRMQIDWSLTNRFLGFIWNKPPHIFATGRCNYSKPAATLGDHRSPYAILHEDGQFHKTVRAQLTLAIAAGITPRWEELAKFNIHPL